MSSSTAFIKAIIGGPSDFGIGWIVILISSFITILIAGIGLLNWLIVRLGEKGAFLRKLSRLTIGMDIRNFENILGSPVFINRLEDKLSGYEEFVFSNKYYYTQAVINPIKQVVLFSITIKNKNFNPSFQIGGSGRKIKLGKTVFSDIGEKPEKTFRYFDHGGIGFYSEIHFFGRPGHYLEYAFSVNFNGPMSFDYITRLSVDDSPDNPEAIKQFRLKTPINTFTIIGNMRSDDITDLILGPRTGQVWNLNDSRYRE